MPSQTLPAIVLRHVNYKDNDRMLTLFSPEKGRIDVLCRGCRRPKSPLMGASEVFATGEYLIYNRIDKNTVTGCTIHDAFYPLRLDYNKLSQGVYLLNLCEAAVQPGEAAPDLFRLLIKTLHCLSYGDQDDKGLLTIFLIHYANLLGYKPRLFHCVHCAKKIDLGTPFYFDIDAGGICCPGCPKPKNALPISNSEVLWLREALRTGPENSNKLSDLFPDASAPFYIIQSFVHNQLDRPIKSGNNLFK